VLIEHRGEAEYDFRHLLHTSYKAVVREDVDEALRLTGQLLRDPGSRVAAAVAGWERPISVEGFLLASVYAAWTGERHPLMPDLTDRAITDVDARLADMALENMNRR
jgi:hypothetical protein